MKWYVDTCALLNLCATDRIEAIVADLGLTLRVVPKVYLEETLYLYGRIEDTRGERESLDLSPLLNKGVIHADDPLVDAELETFLAYAALMDDGEAETIAAAELRHGGVVTDELRAWRVLQDHAPQVSRITSLGLIKQWGEANQIEGDILRTMLEGMRIRASYVPSQRQPHYAWYKKLFKIDKP